MPKHHPIYSNETLWRGYMMTGFRITRSAIYDLTSVVVFLFLLQQISAFDLPADWEPAWSGGWNSVTALWKTFMGGGLKSAVLVIATALLVATSFAARRERKAIESLEDKLSDLMSPYDD